MTEPNGPSEVRPPELRRLADLLREEVRLLPRLRGVLRFDPAVYADLRDDPHALPPAFAVVIGTSLLVGLGQASLAGVFLAIAGAIAVWALAAALVWAVGSLVAGERAEYPKLLRCLGFAWAWNALALGASLPLVGALLEWGGALLWAGSAFIATRTVLGIGTDRAVGVCALALGIPLLVLLALVRST